MRSTLRILGIAAVVSTSFVGCIIDEPTFVGPEADANTGIDGPVAPARLTTEQQPHVFPDVTIGQNSGSLLVVIANSGTAISGPIQLALSGDVADFEILAAGDCMGAVLAASESCTASVRFTPSSTGTRVANLEVSATPGGMVSVELTGHGLTAGDLEITEGAVLMFDATEIAAQSEVKCVTVRNNGGTATAALTVMLADSTNYFRGASDTCDGLPLAAGADCTVEIGFRPTVVGESPTQLWIRESDAVGVPASLSGTGSARVRVTKNGTGTGTIVSTQPGISCGAGCASAEAPFTQPSITLTASVVSGHVFEGWGGACESAGLNPECIVPVTVPLTTVTATFRAWECTPDTIVCDDATEHYVDCSPTGTIDLEIACPLGCASGVEKCLDVNPSNDVAPYLDQAAVDPDVHDIVLTGSSIINTTTGAVINGNGVTEAVPHATFGFLKVFMFRSLSIAGTLKITGSRAAVLVSDGAVMITGTVDVSGDREVPGPQGGGPGGLGACAGDSPPLGLSFSGAGGGGHAHGGGNGGNGNGSAGAAGGEPIADTTLVPLRSGCGGGTGRNQGSCRVNRHAARRTVLAAA